MTSLLLRAVVLLGWVAAPCASAQLQQADVLPVSGPRLFAATTNDATSGALVELLAHTRPGFELLAPTTGARHLRRFGKNIYAVDTNAGTILRVPHTGGPSQLYDLGMGSKPMDIAVPPAALGTAGTAWVSRRDQPFLLRLDLASGVGSDAIDLTPLGAGAAIALGTMQRQGTRLFVQVRVSGANDEVPGLDTGVLAVVDLTTETLIDVDPGTPGIQGVTLQGAPPRFKMQIVDDTLYVSTTDSFNDIRGGIERVDLNTLTSVGYAVSEASGDSDMGGFVMLDDERGYYLFHTDLLASTHLKPFTVTGGPGPGFELIVLLGDTVDSLAYDPQRRRLYLPSGFSTNGAGLYVLDTDSNLPIGGPIATGLRPHDALIFNGPLPAGPVQ